jgi:hypothetical protein
VLWRLAHPADPALDCLDYPEPLQLPQAGGHHLPRDMRQPAQERVGDPGNALAGTTAPPEQGLPQGLFSVGYGAGLEQAAEPLRDAAGLLGGNEHGFGSWPKAAPGTHPSGKVRLSRKSGLTEPLMPGETATAMYTVPPALLPDLGPPSGAAFAFYVTSLSCESVPARCGRATLRAAS